MDPQKVISPVDGQNLARFIEIAPVKILFTFHILKPAAIMPIRSLFGTGGYFAAKPPRKPAILAKGDVHLKPPWKGTKWDK